jgi:hypothetical protein
MQRDCYARPRMHRQINTVAILMIIHGSIESLLGILLAAMGPIMFGFMKMSPSGSRSGAPKEGEIVLMSVIYGVLGVLVLAAGVLKIVAGIKNMKYRSRTLGIVALSSAIVSMFTCYCLPTALALAVYGLIVYLNEQSARAFQMGDQGMSPNEIRAALEQVPAYGYGQPQYPQPPYPPQG